MFWLCEQKLSSCVIALSVSVFNASAVQINATTESSGAGSVRPSDPLPAPGLWTHLGRTTDRRSLVLGSDPGPTALGDIAWVATEDGLGSALEFSGPGGVVADKKRVFASARINSVNHAIGVDRVSGDVLWATPIGNPIFNSWSTPAIDLFNGTVLYAQETTLDALRREDGSVVWSTDFGLPLVNASPVVTTDLGPADRAFITNYGVLAPPGRLYCVNVDPFDAWLNPYQPGEIVWTAILSQPTAGATPAYRSGVVYVATSGVSQVSPGTVEAFDATSTSAPAALWTVSAPGVIPQGFFGGVSVSGGFVYASTFNFFGGQLSSCLVKIDAATGQLMWSALCNRTSSIPIPMGDGRIALSSGLFPDAGNDFGSRPSVQLFRDHGSFGELLWDSAIDTWNDTNLNGVLDTGEYLAIGGWSHQPVLRKGPGKARLYVGTVNLDDALGIELEPYNEMRLIDLDKLPTDPGFVIDSATGYGSTPAIVGSAIFSIGPAGLTRVGQAPAPAQGRDRRDDPSAQLETIWRQFTPVSSPEKGE